MLNVNWNKNITDWNIRWLLLEHFVKSKWQNWIVDNEWGYLFCSWSPGRWKVLGGWKVASMEQAALANRIQQCPMRNLLRTTSSPQIFRTKNSTSLCSRWPVTALHPYLFSYLWHPARPALHSYILARNLVVSRLWGQRALDVTTVSSSEMKPKINCRNFVVTAFAKRHFT